ncbi:MAG TPA: SPW repeat protein [Anaerolineales bacterium]|nr:SPW repeat protein [Anaerolineales bacterium]
MVHRVSTDPALAEITRLLMKVLNWLIALCGLWELGDIVLPFVIGFDQVQAFVWNHIIVGMILMLAGARAALTGNVRTARTMDWVAAVAGGWLILATFLLRDLTITAGLWNDIIVGVIVLILGVWAALALPRVAG